MVLLFGEILAAMVYMTVGIMIQHTFPKFYDRLVRFVIGIFMAIVLPFRALKMGWDKAGNSLIDEANEYMKEH